ncbi:MAG: purine-nucleoside phosphorylase [Granulicella sp.]
MTDPFLQATAAVQYIRSRSPITPKVGVILGSGLGAFAEQVEGAVAISYGDIPHFTQSTVQGHSGRLVLGTIAGLPVAVMQGRVHAYEGYPLQEVTFPMRVLALLGVRSVIVTNAAGGIRASLKPGELVVLADHINLTGTNAALGPNEPRFGISSLFGQRFFDMSAAYAPRLRAMAVQEGARQGLLLTEGVYLAVLGPSYETPAEIRAFRTLGADLVGMSTVHEVIVARHMGIEVLGLSLVTNMAAGVANEKIDHEEVMATGRNIAQQFTTLLTALIPQIAEIFPE